MKFSSIAITGSNSGKIRENKTRASVQIITAKGSILKYCRVVAASGKTVKENRPPPIKKDMVNSQTKVLPGFMEA